MADARASVALVRKGNLTGCPNSMPKNPDLCEFPLCPNLGSRRTINLHAQSRRLVLNLCDDHHNNILSGTFDTAMIDWLASLLWPP
jgi:hypothetical protein